MQVCITRNECSPSAVKRYKAVRPPKCQCVRCWRKFAIRNPDSQYIPYLCKAILDHVSKQARCKKKYILVSKITDRLWLFYDAGVDGYVMKNANLASRFKNLEVAKAVGKKLRNVTIFEAIESKNGKKLTSLKEVGPTKKTK